jgi:hypothetical protein
MPFDYGLRLDNRQRIANARAKPIEANKNQSVDGAESLFLGSGSPQNVYLLPQHPNFYLKRRPRPDQIDDHPNNEPDKISHHATASPDSRSTASQIGFATGTPSYKPGVPTTAMCRSSFLAVLSQPEHLAAQVEIVAQVFGRPLVDHPAALQRYRGIRQR